MSIGKCIFFGLVLTFLLTGCSKPVTYNWRDGDQICARIDSHNYLLEVAQSAQAREKGLMNRRELARYRGMLFIFNRTSTHSFWMKNTYVPLDLVWLDGNFQALAQQSMPVEKDPANPTNSYTSPQPAHYAIEINQNETEIPVGGTLSFVDRAQCD